MLTITQQMNFELIFCKSMHSLEKKENAHN